MKFAITMVRAGGILIFISGITYALKGILEATQRENIVLINSLIAFVFTIITAIITLKSSTSVLMLIAYLLIFYFLCLILNLFIVIKLFGVRMQEMYSKIIKIIIATIVLAIIELLLDKLLVMNFLLLVLSVLIGYFIYFMILVFSGGITRKDVQSLKDTIIYIPIHFFFMKFHIR